MYDPYHDKYRPTLQLDSEHVNADYEYAISQLADLGAPTTVYIDIWWDGSTIMRISDNLSVGDWTMATKFKYFGHLRGLFRKALDNHYYV